MLLSLSNVAVLPLRFAGALFPGTAMLMMSSQMAPRMCCSNVRCAM